MLKPIQLPANVVSILTERLKDEYAAHYFYRNASNWCKNVGYLKAGAFFDAEASSELEHAQGIQDYLTDWNVTFSLPVISPPAKVSALTSVIEAAYEIEYDLYESYEKNSNTILFDIKDTCTFDFLAKYRTIQRESVAEYATLINKLTLFDNKDKNFLFLFEQENF
jgi:ferritin